MELQVGKWGNSLAIRLPSALAKQAGLCEGGRVRAEVGAGRELRLVSSGPAANSTSRAALADTLVKMHQDWPMGRPVVRWMRDQGY
jgi:antitoxin MazE